MRKVLKSIKNKITTEHLFMISVLFVNGGNYVYNLILGRILGPEKFADAAILITFLLVLSFIAMTFQLVTAKFSVLFEKEIFKVFKDKIYRQAFIVGVFLSVLIILFSSSLQHTFNTTSSSMFVVFGLGIPFYFLMSVNRGVYQGKNKLISLSVTYQSEMISRLLITLLLLQFCTISTSLIIAIGIFCSFILGLIPFKKITIPLKKIKELAPDKSKMVKSFFLITAFYELTQIIINNSDIF